MKLKLSISILIAIALSLSVSAQENDRSLTFTDHLGQTISIDKAGTVRAFTDSKGQKIAPNNTFTICPCGRKCVASTDPGTTKSRPELHVDFPTQGAALKKGETLSVTARVESPEMTVTRKLSWLSGSSVVSIDENVATPSATKVCNFRESGMGLLKNNPCPDPPGMAKCPFRSRLKDEPCPDPPGTAKCPFRSSKAFQIKPGLPVHVRFLFDLSRSR